MSLAGRCSARPTVVMSTYPAGVTRVPPVDQHFLGTRNAVTPSKRHLCVGKAPEISGTPKAFCIAKNKKNCTRAARKVIQSRADHDRCPARAWEDIGVVVGGPLFNEISCAVYMVVSAVSQARRNVQIASPNYLCRSLFTSGMPNNICISCCRGDWQLVPG